MNLRHVLTSLLILTVLFVSPSVFGQPVSDQTPAVIPVPSEAQASPNFDAEKATEAYLALMPASARARSDAYFEGGYWLILWDFLYGVVVALFLLNLGWSAKMRDLSERITRFKPLQAFIYWLQYLLVTSIMVFPLTVYEGYFREHKYGLATQTFGPWMGDQLKGLLVNFVLGGLLVMGLFGVVRRLRKTWWIWGAVVTTIGLIVTVLIAPIYIFPLFNTIKRLENPRIVDPILSMARANGIPARDVFEIDASRQTTRMSANVSGFGKTMRITLNDNLIRRGSLEEIQAVMGHEMGHYVLHHIYKGITFYFIVIVFFFAYLHWSLDLTLARWGGRWKIRDIADPAVLPLAVLLVSVLAFAWTPIDNTFTRTQEHEADMYGLNASRQPDGFAQAAIHLGEYRKMSPGPVEEWIFFDHPSGRNRISDAMRWKAENLRLFMSDAPSAAVPVSAAPTGGAKPH